MKHLLALLALFWGAGTELVFAATCEEQSFEGLPYTVCHVDVRQDDLRLFLRDDEGEVLGQFTKLDRLLESQGERLVFAMNAGMYHPDRRPVGFYVEDSLASADLLMGASDGNFGLLPNGVFCIRGDRADVFETLSFASANPACVYATQSGPMLVIDGELHPRFLPDGTSLHIRNGVGTSADGQAVIFAISDAPVNFHTFGRFFRDHIGVPNALFLDGSISRLYAPELNRSDFGFAVGPIVGVVTPLSQ